MSGDERIETPEIPAGGWGSAKTTVSLLLQEGVLFKGGRVLAHQNKDDGFACVSCAWAKPAHPHAIEACENGIKATAWEVTDKRTPPAFFAQHSVAELLTWADRDLEDEGRLTDPLKWNPDTDRYEPVAWAAAFSDIAARLVQLDPKSVVFYASGRASLETAYLYQLMARLYGNNNLPDSSNMCHESTSVGLLRSIGVPVGTVGLDDFEHTDCILFFGQNVGTNSPRMLHQLQDVRKRGVPVITFNPLRERGLVEFINPLSPMQMLTGAATAISTQYHQVKIGGDIAAITGMCKVLLEADAAALATGEARVLDVDFLAVHTQGFDQFAAYVDACSWEALERESGLGRAALRAAALTYMRAERVIAVYGMGLTQHRRGVENVQMVTNLLLLRGNIGKPGAGLCPVRGHSNVQGQRTVGITEKPELVPLAQLEQRYGFTAPRDKGLNTVETCRGVLDGSVRAFVGLGGNFVRAVPETGMMEASWRNLALTVQIATKLNRSHLVHGAVSYILPCRGRIEIDRQASGPQSVTIEDSTGCMHGSRGVTEPASANLLSEPAIIAGIAKALLPARPETPWDAWIGDYALIRNEIEALYPEIFHDFNARKDTPGGFRRPMPAAERIWKTESRRANFITPRGLDANPDMPARDADVLRLMTIRSDDQFNTTIYTLDDRFRGVVGTRRVIFMNAADITRLGCTDGEHVTLATVTDDGVSRSVADMRITAFDIPSGCAAGYFPECNPLIPLWHHAKDSFVPAAKSIPVRVLRVNPPAQDSTR